ncbi:hypothetical protein XENOCAPTIV_017677 [Xenoophorus captivus]|uniref:Protein THEM6 n=1 Tax=Xenoophorus captivus TaxID=1517983 RepID=A0ABV0QIW9_9TELE
MYEQEAKKHTEEHAGKSLDDMEKKLMDPVPQFVPQHLLCPLTKKVFVDPVRTVYGTVYERKAIEEHLKQHKHDPLAGPGHELEMSVLMSDWNMKKMNLFADVGSLGFGAAFEMWWVVWLLAALVVLFCTLDVWYFLRAGAVILRAWFQPPVWDITGEQVITGRVTPHDIDMCHMNNARYLRECDFARFSLYMRNGVFKAVWALGGNMVVAATTIRYRRALCIGEAYDLCSRIVTWDDKAFFLEQRFVSTKDRLVCAVMYCKQSVIRCSPDKILQHLCKRKVR